MYTVKEISALEYDLLNFRNTHSKKNITITTAIEELFIDNYTKEYDNDGWLKHYNDISYNYKLLNGDDIIRIDSNGYRSSYNSKERCITNNTRYNKTTIHYDEYGRMISYLCEAIGYPAKTYELFDYDECGRIKTFDYNLHPFGGKVINKKYEFKYNNDGYIESVNDEKFDDSLLDAPLTELALKRYYLICVNDKPIHAFASYSDKITINAKIYPLPISGTKIPKLYNTDIVMYTIKNGLLVREILYNKNGNQIYDKEYKYNN